MILLFSLLILIYFYKKTQHLNQNDKVVLFLLLGVVIIGLFLYRAFLEYSAGWLYGIPGTDTLSHYLGAERIAQGYSWNELSDLGMRFKELGIGTIGYFIYTEFLAIVLFFPVLFDMHVNIYLVTLSQCVIIAIIGINFSIVFSKMLKIESRSCKFTIYAFLLCAANFVTAYRLLRETWSVLLFSESLCILSQKRKKNMVASALMIVVSILLRPYMILLEIPLIAYFAFNEKLGMVASITCLAILVFGSTLIAALAPIFSIGWGMSTVALEEVVYYLLFPNVLNQSKILLGWNFQSSINYLSGVNVPLVNYTQSVWNVYMLCIFGAAIIVKTLAKIKVGFRVKTRNATTESYTTYMWIFIMLSICALYSIVYASSTMMLRHKMMIVPSIVYLAQKCFSYMKRQNGGIMVFNCAFIALIFAVLVIALF